MPPLIVTKFSPAAMPSKGKSVGSISTSVQLLMDEHSNSLANLACHLERDVEVTEAFRALLKKVPSKEVRIFRLLLTHVPHHSAFSSFAQHINEKESKKCKI